MLGLVEGNSWGWGSPEILGLFALSVVSLAGFAWIETRSPAPVVDFAFFRSRQFFGANAVAFMVTFAMFAMFFFLALYMQNILGYSPLQTGVRFLPSTLLVMIAGPISGRLSDRIGPRWLMTGGLLLIAIAMAWQSRVGLHTSYAFLLPAFMIMGLGIGLVMSPMSAAAMNAVDRTKAGVASGTLSMSRMVGGTFGVAALGALVAAVGRNDLEQSLPNVAAPVRDKLVDGLGSGAGLQGATAHVHTAVNSAFVDALSTGLLVSAGAALIGAVLSWAADQRQPSARARRAGGERRRRRANCGSVTTPPLPPHLDEFLKQANPSVIGTLDPDGTPHTAATWYLWEGGRVLVNMDATRKRLEHLRQNPGVSITVLGSDNWYQQVTLRGRVVEIADDPDLEGIDRLCTHYMGGPYSARDQQRVNAWIEVESWYSWNGGAPWD